MSDGGLDPELTARVLVAIGLGMQVQKVMDPETALGGCADVVKALLTGTFATGTGRSDEEKENE